MSDEPKPYYQDFMLDHNYHHQKTDQESNNMYSCEKQFSTFHNLDSSQPNYFDPSSYNNMSFTESLQGGNMDHYNSPLATSFGVLSPSSSEVFSSVDQGNQKPSAGELGGGDQTLATLNSSISNSSSSEAGGVEEEDSGKRKKNIGQVKEEPGQESSKNG